MTDKPTVKNWAFVAYRLDPYKAPEQMLVMLTGDVYNRKDYPDGSVVTTSPVVDIKEECGVTVVTTMNSVYQLEGPANPEYAAYRKAYGLDPNKVSLGDKIKF